MPDLELFGCHTQPLLSYLKALGVFRHVAKVDPQARLCWHREGFAILRTRFDDDGLVDFFLDEYEPSPITSPWNGGSGYYQGDNIEAITAVERCDAPRLGELRKVIAAARELIGSVAAAPSPNARIGDKDALLESWRAQCPDSALDWLDAAVVIAEDGPTMNPLLGTGGNDGRFEFSNNFLARLVECLPHLFGPAERELQASRLRLRAALYDEPARLGTAAIGMFHPGGAGLPNSSSSQAESGVVNCWDFVLLLEGASLFGGNVARRLSAERATFPFTVREALRVGTSLDLGADAKTRGETWLPIWRRPASIGALRRLLGEGRIQDSRHQARAGREMFRAAADVGVDRGIDAFERVVYAERFGRNYVAVPAGRVDVHAVRVVELTRAADVWLRRVSRVDTTSIRSRLATLERMAMELATGSDESAALERWLLALAETQRAVARRPASRAVSEPTHIRPLSGLPRRIVTSIGNSVEHRLARVLAAAGREPDEVGLRSLTEPVSPTRNGGFAWTEERGHTEVTLLQPEALLIALARHGSGREMPPERRARLRDILTFLAGETDDERLVHLAYAFTLCGPCDQPRSPARSRLGGIDRLYAATRLVTCDPVARRPGGTEQEVELATDVISALAGGRAAAAARAAARRLRADGLAPVRAIESLDRPPAEARRIAAALAFPLHPDDRTILEHAVLTPEPTAQEASPSPEGVLV